MPLVAQTTTGFLPLGVHFANIFEPCPSPATEPRENHFRAFEGGVHIRRIFEGIRENHAGELVLVLVLAVKKIDFILRIGQRDFMPVIVKNLTEVGPSRPYLEL